ncbi:MAG: CrcB family protein [Candidatus Hydrogenedentes bacterium]|nr:CrcB family protein [Candidatus Hydrogenedentota bacterium]
MSTSLLLKIGAVATFGALGALARFGVYGIVRYMGWNGFPWATFTVNMLGCLLFGLFVSLAEHRFEFSDVTKVAILVGFMGSFTTFSTFALDGSALLREGQWLLATLYIGGQNFLGIGAIFLGLYLGRYLGYAHG